jgi:superfamily II DNA or RNA helicase|tara:strand:+ start:35150 stop:36634 length:1485 start_codon:yes stop_codon:yes gene_type:complete
MVENRYLILEKKDEVYLSIEAESDIRRELSEFFTFEVPGYKFMPQYRSRYWDGKIRLFKYASGEIYYGLLPYIKKFCEDNNISIVSKIKEKAKPLDKLECARFCKALKIPKITIRDYQFNAFYHAIQEDRCLLLSPTASGKSLIAYLILRFQLLRIKEKKSNKVLIIVPTTSLVEQLYKDFAEYGYNTKHIHRIYQGHDKDTTKKVVISTWQSIYKLPKTWFAQFGCIIGDEAHLFKSQSLTGIMTKMTNCKYRIGMTGTLDGSKTHKLVLEGLFGAVNRVASTTDLIDKKQLAAFKIHCLILKHGKNSKDFLKDKNYQEEMDFLCASKARNKYITNLTNGLQGNTLLLFQFVEKHGKILQEQIEKKVDDGRKVFFVYGGVSADDRENIRAITEKSDNAIIVASYGTFSTGINIRNLHNIIFSSPSKSRIRNLQSIGRGLRLGDNKVNATLYDISDDVSHGEKENYTLQHFRERINIYNEENFDYEIHNVELKE